MVGQRSRAAEHGNGSDESSFDAPIDCGGIDVFDSLFVCQPIRPGETATMRGLVADWASEQEDGDVRTLLPVRGVSFVTLFFDTGAFGWQEPDTSDSERGGQGSDAGADALVWYVEVADDDAQQWDDPDRTIRASSPLFAAGIGDLLEAGADIHADGREGHQLITHATNPYRQERYAEHVGSSLVAPVAGEDLPIDVVVTTIPLKPGLRSRLVSRLVAAGNWLKRFDRLSDWLRGQTDTLEAETMYSESLLLEDVGGRLVLHYYMEAEDAEQVWDAYHSTDNWDARFSDWAMRRIFDSPEAFLEQPIASDCELLVHAVHPDRP